ncbi:MAG: hypothetical protein L0177_05280 [Chloroflexi bacterium]|nr:hypothetical protein [Chloroflexota bacterium]
MLNEDLVTLLIGYVKGITSIPELKEWLAERVWDLSSSTSPLDRMMLGELELALAEYDRGDRDDSYLKERVRFLLKLPNPELVPQLGEFRG